MNAPPCSCGLWICLPGTNFKEMLCIKQASLRCASFMQSTPFHLIRSGQSLPFTSLRNQGRGKRGSRKQSCHTPCNKQASRLPALHGITASHPPARALLRCRLFSGFSGHSPLAPTTAPKGRPPSRPLVRSPFHPSRPPVREA